MKITICDFKLGWPSSHALRLHPGGRRHALQRAPRALAPFRSTSPSCAPSSNSAKSSPPTATWPAVWINSKANTTPSFAPSLTPSGISCARRKSRAAPSASRRPPTRRQVAPVSCENLSHGGCPRACPRAKRRSLRIWGPGGTLTPSPQSRPGRTAAPLLRIGHLGSARLSCMPNRNQNRK